MGSSSSSPIKQEKPVKVNFHRLHGNNVQLSPDWQSAKRLRGFEHAITLSDRPITRNRYIDIRIKETNPSWRGVLRLGVTSQHPGMLTRDNLPSCACPNLEERDQFWVGPIQEAIAVLGSEIYFYVTSNGELICSKTVAGKRQAYEEDVVLQGLPTRGDLWMVMDVYGQTTEVEMFEPKTALIVVQNKPGGGMTERQRVAKLQNRGTEDPKVENAINLAILQQREAGQGSSAEPEAGQGSSAEPEAGQGSSAEHDTQAPPPPTTTPSAPPPLQREEPNETPEEATPEETPETSTEDNDRQEPAAESGNNKPEGAQPLGECVMCLDATADYTVYRCGHQCMCQSCATVMKEKPEAECPVCREPIEDVIRTYQP